MKRLFLFSTVLFILNSCAYYRQVCSVQSNLDNSTNAYTYSDNACEVIYDFWSEGGKVCFMIENKTDSVIYVDLTKSYFVKNGFSFDYYLNRIVESSKSTSSTIGTAVSGSIYGYWNNIKDYKGNKMPGSLTITDAASSTVINSASVSYIEKPIISVFPYTIKVFSEYSIMDERYRNKTLDELPIGDEEYLKLFDTDTTPVKFENVICYRIGQGEDRYIYNYFYISKITNTRVQNSKKSYKSFYFDYVNH